MTGILASFGAPKPSTVKNSDGSRSATLAFTHPVTGVAISCTVTLSIDSDDEAHLAFNANGIAIDSAWSDT